MSPRLENEDDPVAVTNLETPVNRASLDLGAGLTCAMHPVQGKAPLGWRFRGLNRKGRLRQEIEDPVHDLFGAVRRDLLQRPATAHRDQEEQAPAHHGEGLQEFKDRRQIVDGFLCHQGIDLNWHRVVPLRGLYRSSVRNIPAQHVHRRVESRRNRRD
jgi:hypothetical protein